MIFLDSNICIAAMKGNRTVAFRLIQASGHTSVSTIVVAELRFGADHSAKPTENHQRIDAFLECASVIPFSEQAAVAYGQLRHTLQIKGELIGERDMLIASEALANDSVLISHNSKEFSRVPKLRFTDWLS